MKSNLKIFTCMAVAMLIAMLPLVQCKAQTATVTDGYIKMGPAGANSDTLNGTFVIILSDTTGITNLEVKIGTDLNQSDILSATFAYDVHAGLAAGYSYERDGYKVILGIGTYTDKSTYFCQARLQRSNGTWTDPLRFVAN